VELLPKIPGVNEKRKRVAKEKRKRVNEMGNRWNLLSTTVERKTDLSPFYCPFTMQMIPSW